MSQSLFVMGKTSFYRLSPLLLLLSRFSLGVINIIKEISRDGSQDGDAQKINNIISNSVLSTWGVRSLHVIV